MYFNFGLRSVREGLDLCAATPSSESFMKSYSSSIWSSSRFRFSSASAASVCDDLNLLRKSSKASVSEISYALSAVRLAGILTLLLGIVYRRSKVKEGHCALVAKVSNVSGSGQLCAKSKSGEMQF